MSDCCPFDETAPGQGIPDSAWERAWQVHSQLFDAEREVTEGEAPPEVMRLVDARQQAREKKQWQLADELRAEIAALGWQVLDTPQGSKLVKVD